MDTLKLNCFGIKITHNPASAGVAFLVSDMKAPISNENASFNAAVTGLESLILAQFCAGVDVTTPAYLEAVETSFEAISNAFD